jgi:CRISPR system Cascade subunit CasA
VTNRFNLIDEPWIPVAGAGRVSLLTLFSDPSLGTIGGTPIEKIALFKLVMAIAQAAQTPADEVAYQALTSAGLAEQCRAYLAAHHAAFFLYGERPFLQIPAIKAAALQPYGAILPDVSTGNTTVLLATQIERPLSDAERAVLLVTQMGFALGGKKTDNSVTLSAGYQRKKNDKGKPSTGKAGPSVEFLGVLHSFIEGPSLQDTVLLNLMTDDGIARSQMFPGGVGVAPWEAMPTGEDCATARELVQSLMGRLIPLCRFCLLTDNGLHYSEGILHPGYKDGITDPSTTALLTGKKPSILWVDPQKRPWRSVTALLGVMTAGDAMFCRQVQIGMGRAVQAGIPIRLWSGGLRVSSNAGEQYVSGADDFVDSDVTLPPNVTDDIGFQELKAEMEALDAVSRIVYSSVSKYCAEVKVDGKGRAGKACELYWQLCERHFQGLLNACYAGDGKAEALSSLHRVFTQCALQSFDSFCPQGTARQLNAWAKARPKAPLFNREKARKGR